MRTGEGEPNTRVTNVNARQVRRSTLKLELKIESGADVLGDARTYAHIHTYTHTRTHTFGAID